MSEAQNELISAAEAKDIQKSFRQVDEIIRQLSILDQKSNALLATIALIFAGLSAGGDKAADALYHITFLHKTIDVLTILKLSLLISAATCLRCLTLISKSKPWALEFYAPTSSQLEELFSRGRRIVNRRRYFYFTSFYILCAIVGLMIFLLFAQL